MVSLRAACINASSKHSRGYAFINFEDPAVAKLFSAIVADGHLICGKRQAGVTHAHMQGQEELRAFFQKKSVMRHDAAPMFADYLMATQPGPVVTRNDGETTGVQASAFGYLFRATVPKDRRSSPRWADMVDEDDF
eukprot:TRINITY_DN12082_c0_g1_i5.p2 TRINITY_DN12082_c0_g1~~TRINITY_DN12082_c0_g1_i5.p2  ORF type:complete len:136 (+),score=20.55 TRINITY_DN12082_c0_g1_i5:243-650(+)